jgi:CheY-like chemotaxis protein
MENIGQTTTQTPAPCIFPESGILIVEDSPEDFEAITRSFKKLGITNPIYHCTSGEEALNFLYKRKEFSNPDNKLRPSVILLDLNLPGTDGRDVLKEVKNDPNLKSIPIVVLTTSNSEKDISECYQQGADNYVVKPADWKDLFKEMEGFKTNYLNNYPLPDGQSQAPS